MALTPQIRAPQAGVLGVVRSTVPELHVAQGGVMAVYNVPAEFINATQAGITVTFRQTSVLEATQAGVLAVVKGRIANPRIRAWTFSLDGHDFYVLRLGDTLTLVYDVYSEQWMDWISFNKNFWRPNIGVNWIGGAALADTYGSSVVIGDDTYGLLWFLDPDQPYDEDPDYVPDVDQYFERIVMGQSAINGRAVVPCFTAWLTTDMGSPAYTGAGVRLEISDDAGNSFFDAGIITVDAGNYSPQIAWYSLGQIAAPGRLFKITDDGAITRIDSMEMDDGR